MYLSKNFSVNSTLCEGYFNNFNICLTFAAICSTLVGRKPISQRIGLYRLVAICHGFSIHHLKLPNKASRHPYKPKHGKKSSHNSKNFAYIRTSWSSNTPTWVPHYHPIKFQLNIPANPTRLVPHQHISNQGKQLQLQFTRYSSHCAGFGLSTPWNFLPASMASLFIVCFINIRNINVYKNKA